MSNFFKKTKRAWEENDYDKIHNQYPSIEQEYCFPIVEPMFSVFKLREAWEYYNHNIKSKYDAEHFYEWLCQLEKDVPFNQQKYQP